MSRDLTSKVKGKKIYCIDRDPDNDLLVIEFTDSSELHFYHEQDCCEAVWLEQINDDLDAFDYAVVTSFEEKEIECGGDDYGTYTATFYTMKTSAGYLDFNFRGESNGYYSEGIDIKFIERL